MRIYNYLRESLQHRRLRFDIVSSFLGLFLISSSLLVGYFYQGSKSANINIAQSLLNQITDTTAERAGSYLSDAKKAAVFTNTLVNPSIPNFMEDENLKSNFIKILDMYPDFTSVQVALFNGDYLSVERVNPGTKYVKNPDKSLQDNIVYLSQHQKRTSKDKPPYEVWTYYDKFGKLVSNETNESLVYDARKRPWFINTEQRGGFNWSQVYMFSFMNVPGTTAGLPLFEKDATQQKMIGVIGIDVSLAEISHFLGKHKSSQNCLIVIVNGEGQLVASTKPEYILPLDTRSENIRHLADVNDKSLNLAYDIYKKTGKSSFDFIEGTTNYLSSFLTLKNESNSDWNVCVVVPEDDFLTETKKIRQNVFYMILLSILVFTGLIFLLSKRISRPIIVVAEETKKIQDLDIGSDINLNSGIYEIQLMLKSLSAMKSSLNSFIKFVPKTLVKKLLHKGGEVKLGGTKKDLTIFFSDIANFTNISEGISPEKLVAHLSMYFDELTKILNDANGNIDKYIGDSIMAFWGAPIHDRDQTFNACHAALKCQKRLFELNRQWELEGKPLFKTRIGLHRAEVLVGIIGSQERMNYTVMGDGVNLASRLEGMNKEYGTLIAVSENIVAHVENDFLFRPLDIIAVKGKTKPVKIYELMAQYKDDSSLLPTKEQKTLADLFTNAFKLYTLQKFDEALRIYKEISTLYPQDYATQVFIERCNDFKMNPPPSDWDGVKAYTHK